MLGRPLLRVFLVGMLAMLLAGCVSNSPPQAIIGTWQSGMGDKKRTMTFWDNGVWTMETGQSKQTGAYKFLSENQLEMKVDGPSDTKPLVFKRTISFAHHNQMNMTDTDTTRRTTWKRVESP